MPIVKSKTSLMSCKESPKFPVDAVRRRIEGWVLLEYTLDSNGAPLGMQVIDSSPKGYFEKAALASYSTCRFTEVQEINPGEKLQTTLEFKFS